MPTKGKPIIPESYQMVLVADNATNGDVIKAMFPDAEIEEISTSLNGIIVQIIVRVDREVVLNCTFKLKWWNAPYKEV